MDGNAFRMRFLAMTPAAAVAAFALRHGTVATRLTSGIEREATAALEFHATFDDLSTATHLAAAERNSVAAVFQVGHPFASAAQLTALVVYGFPAALPVRNSVLDDAIAAGLPIRIHLLAVAVTKQGGLCATLNETVSSLVEASHVVATEPNLPQDIATDLSPAPAIRPAHLPTPDASYARAVKAVTTSVADCRTPVVEDSSGPEWQTVQARRMTAVPKPNNVARQRAPQQPSQQQPPVSKPKKGAVIGKARHLPIKAAKRFANVFVARLDPNENEVSIKRHLESTLKLDVTVELCKQSDSQSSFHLSCLCPDPSVFMSDDLWPEGTYLRWWR